MTHEEIVNKVLISLDPKNMMPSTRELCEIGIRRAIKEERETCEKLAELDCPEGVSDWGKGYVRASQTIAQAIRARGSNP